MDGDVIKEPLNPNISLTFCQNNIILYKRLISISSYTMKATVEQISEKKVGTYSGSIFKPLAFLP